MSSQRSLTRDLLLSVIAGGIAAALFAAIFMGGLVGTFSIYFSSLPLMVVGLSLGCAAAMVSSLSGIAVLSVIGSGPSSAMVYIAADVIPSMLIICLGLLSRKKGQWKHSLKSEQNSDRQWFPVGSILCWLSFASSVLVAISALLFCSGMLVKNIPEGTAIEAYISSYVAMVVRQAVIDNPDFKDSLLSGVVPILPALLAMCWAVKAMLASIVAMWGLNKKSLNLRPVPDYNALDLPKWHYAVLLIAAAFWIFWSGNVAFTAKNIAIVMALPLMFQGVAYAHRLAGKTKFPRICLTVFYILFVLGMDLMTGVIVVLGLFEETTKMRKIKNDAEGQEEI